MGLERTIAPTFSEQRRNHGNRTGWPGGHARRHGELSTARIVPRPTVRANYTSPLAHTTVSKLSGLLGYMVTRTAQPNFIQFEKGEATIQFPVDSTPVGAIGLVSHMAARYASVQPFPQVRAMLK